MEEKNGDRLEYFLRFFMLPVLAGLLVLSTGDYMWNTTHLNWADEVEQAKFKEFEWFVDQYSERIKTEPVDTSCLGITEEGWCIMGRYNGRYRIEVGVNNAEWEYVTSHEIGHVFYYDVMTAYERVGYTELYNNDNGTGVTNYGSTRVSEDFAEFFAYVQGFEGKGAYHKIRNVDKERKEFIEQMLKKYPDWDVRVGG